MPAEWDKRIIPLILLALSEGLAIVTLCQIRQSGETRLTPLLEGIVPSATVAVDLKLAQNTLAGKFGRQGTLWPLTVLNICWAIDRVMSLAGEHPFVHAAHLESFKSALINVLATRSSTAQIQICLHMAMLTYWVYLWIKVGPKARRVLADMALFSF
ncbi:hypothetical protein EVG20_g2229 [Dentipellis fragilis]|uniref:Uncharacterized protein n=1 Tax=Dentipellis fragilis TaxID=205917 RepID=A0A4Y9Z8L1_9AGAM|nr:hypothetical protein EVG20_g2229 [Dentipellis fragilis]